jgi:uncharacterized protein (DUF1778 family)
MASREQLNLRLEKFSFDRLDAAATLQRRTMSDYVKSLLEAHVQVLEEDPHVQRQLRLWAEVGAIAHGSVTPIERGRGKLGKG